MPRDSRRKKPPTPPEDLRSAILVASLALIEKEGVAALSMREVARRLGVTHQAPYHHFDGRGAILQAIVDEGFTKLWEALDRAMVPGGPALENIAAAGHAYVQFALANPGHFRVMFRPELLSERKHESGVPDGFAILVECVKACQREGYIAEGNPMPFVLLAWSTVHGVASLSLDGPARERAGLPGEGAVVDALIGLLQRPLASPVHAPHGSPSGERQARTRR
ncbi:Transcriptional regulator, TetR family protein [Minicystis rosea]|nr:Transcriptional regulator, TetR family protein [Minicystis rosea]